MEDPNSIGVMQLSHWIIFLEFFTFLVGTTIGIYVFTRNPRSRLHQALTLTAIGMAGWNLSIFLLLIQIGSPDMVGRITFSSAALLSASFTWFVYLFPRKIKYYKGFLIFTSTLGIIFILIPFLPQWFTNVQIIESYIIADFDPILFPLWTIFFTGNFIYTFFVLLLRTWQSTGINRLRLFQIILGFITFFLPSQTTNLLLPLLFDDYRWNNLGPVFTIFLLFFLANAILRYRLLDIRWIAGKSIIFSVILGIILWIITTTALLLSDFFNRTIAIAVAALLIVLFFKPITKFLEYVFRKLLHHGGYDPDLATKEIFEIVRTTGDLQSLIDQIHKKFDTYFSTKQIALVVFKPDSKQVLASNINGFQKSIIREIPHLATVVKQHNFSIVESGELEWQLEYQGEKINKGRWTKHISILNKTGVEVLIPFMVEGRLVGLMIFGKRRYDQELRATDVQFLNLIRMAISPALENAAKFAQIKQLYSELSELDKVKSEFINVVSHGFRTPLSTIRWNLENVIDTGSDSLNKDATQALIDIHERTLLLVKTLDQLFETMALESGKIRLTRKDISTKDTFADVINTYKKLSKKKGIKFRTYLPDIIINGDKALLAKIGDCLLSNALQYTPVRGTITFRLSPQGKNIQIQVIDTGIGIPKKDIPKIFNKFYRSKNAVLTFTDGQGMGMFLCKKIVEMHKGKIEVESEINKGTRIIISLPIIKK